MAKRVARACQPFGQGEALVHPGRAVLAAKKRTRLRGAFLAAKLEGIPNGMLRQCAATVACFPGLLSPAGDGRKLARQARPRRVGRRCLVLWRGGARRLALPVLHVGKKGVGIRVLDDDPSRLGVPWLGWKGGLYTKTKINQLRAQGHCFTSPDANGDASSNADMLQPFTLVLPPRLPSSLKVGLHHHTG